MAPGHSTATYLGGPGLDNLSYMDFDAAGNLWVVGSSQFSPTENRRSFLAHVSADGSRLLGERVELPYQVVSGLKVAPDGEVAVLATTLSAGAPTTTNAVLRAGCSTNLFSGYFQTVRPDGTLRFATYLLPSDDRGIDDVYLEYLAHGGQLSSAAGGLALACVTGSASRRNTGRVSPGQIVTLVGSAMGPEKGLVASLGSDSRYPIELGGVRASVGGLPLRLLYVDAWQINAIMPYSLPPGQQVTVSVEYQGKQ